MAEVGDIFVSTDPFLKERRIEIILKEAKNGLPSRFDRDSTSQFIYTYEVLGSTKYGSPRISQVNDSGLSKHYKKEEQDG